MTQEKKRYAAVDGYIIVEIPEKAAKPGEIDTDPFNSQKPNSGIVIDASDALDVTEGDEVLFNYRGGATHIEGRFWSVSIEHSLLAVVPKGVTA